MTSRLFRSMTPDMDSQKKPGLIGIHYTEVVWCERCGGSYAAGDWPWCRGNPEDHRR